MERVLCREIVLDTYSVGTMDVMDYADEHPNEYFDYTNVRSKHTDYGRLVVSDYAPDKGTIAYMDEIGWRSLPNGWERFNNGFSFTCRKDGRYIFITT